MKETLDAQSADIDMVTGATVTSEGYVRSLQAHSTRHACDPAARPAAARLPATSST